MVCQLPDPAAAWGDAWSALAAAAGRDRPDLVVLPELAFCPWLPAVDRFDPAVWAAAAAGQASWLARLPELAPAAVLTTRLAERAGRRVNEAVLWSDGQLRRLHEKVCLPAEPGYHETTWFTPGDAAPAVVPVGPTLAGVAICSELWLFERSRALGQAGARLLLTPRATTTGWNERWLVAGRAAALGSGAYSLSANRAGGAGDFGGQGWIISPSGEVLAVTGAGRPFVTAGLDPTAGGPAYPSYATAEFDRRAGRPPAVAPTPARSGGSASR
jgi:N-carbamoylputrescine amidase